MSWWYWVQAPASADIELTPEAAVGKQPPVEADRQHAVDRDGTVLLPLLSLATAKSGAGVRQLRHHPALASLLETGNDRLPSQSVAPPSC
jgi:hypothetical protein